MDLGPLTSAFSWGNHGLIVVAGEFLATENSEDKGIQIQFQDIVSNGLAIMLISNAMSSLISII